MSRPIQEWALHMTVSVSGLSEGLIGRAGQGTGEQRCGQHEGIQLWLHHDRANVMARSRSVKQMARVRQG